MKQSLLAGAIAVLTLAIVPRAADAVVLADSAEQQRWGELLSSLADAPVDAVQADGSSALLWAAHHDRVDVVTQLLVHKADPNLANRYGTTPLAEAAINGNAEIVSALLEAGALADAPLRQGETPLMLAARTGNAATVRLLLDRGAKVATRDNWHGETALMWAAAENHVEVVRMLLAAGAEVDARSTSFEWKDIKQGGVLSQLPTGGLTALMHAARQNAYDAAMVLVEAGADLGAKDPLGITPLRIATANAHLDLAKALLERGADANDGSFVEVVRARASPMMRAASNRPDRTTEIELLEAMLARGAQIDGRAKVAMPKKDAFGGGGAADSVGETGLYVAALAGDLELMKLLREKGADVHTGNAKGNSIFMAALGISGRRNMGAVVPPTRSIANRLETATWLIEQGARVDTADSTGMTALHAVAEFGKEFGADESVAFLLEHGASLAARDHSNRLPLDVAAGVPAIPVAAPGAPPPAEPSPGKINESTVALLRTAMANAKVAVVPYAKPAKPAPSASAGAPVKPKQVTVVMPPEQG